MLRLVKTTEKPRPAAGLTMGGPPPARIPGAVPGLAFVRDLGTFQPPQEGAGRPSLHLVSSQR